MKKRRFLLVFQYHKTLLLSYQNQNHCIIFQFFAPPEEEVAKSGRSCTRKQVKACKAVGDTSFDGRLNKSRMVSKSNHIKMFQQYLPKNTLENKL